jgi:hypothetical protein
MKRAVLKLKGMADDDPGERTREDGDEPVRGMPSKGAMSMSSVVFAKVCSCLLLFAKVVADRVCTKKRPNSTIENEKLMRTNAIIKYYGMTQTFDY